MGSVKLEQSQKVESAYEKGTEVKENSEQKLEEAETSQSAMDQIEGVDDDDKAALEAARQESDGIAKTIAESEIKEPGREIGASLKETSEQSVEYSETEMADAEKASEMVGNYSEVGGELSGELTQSGQEFQEIAEKSDQINDELQSEYDRIASALEGVF